MSTQRGGGHFQRMTQSLNNQNGRGGYVHQNRPGSYVHQNQNNQRGKKLTFTDYVSEAVAREGLKKGEFIQGSLRVNPRNYEECYINNPEGDDKLDILILGTRDRNRALNGDVVVARFKDRQSWVVREAVYKAWKAGSLKESEKKEESTAAAVVDEPDLLDKMLDSMSVSSEPVRKPVEKQPQRQQNGKKTTLFLQDVEDPEVPDLCLQQTAEVVFILEQKHNRAATGQLKPMTDGNRNFALFSPSDSRIPRMKIPASECPENFFNRPQDFSKFIFLARMVDWPDVFANGKLVKAIGMAGDVEAETEALLCQNDIDTRDYPERILSALPARDGQWKIPPAEFTKRVDLRDEIIFTIDPKTARDLDDALHIKFKENKDGKLVWEVGVHIADVSFFVTEDTELDEWAAHRATSTYLVHKVIPMLPRVLCEELCSLNAGVDRLTFSVIWEIGDDGIIIGEPTFTRSIIRSKVKLAYEHAQDFIENPDKEFATNEIPEVCDGVHVSTIKEKVLQLNAIAMKLKGHRVTAGSLRLDQPKLKFALDEETKMPNGVTIYERKDANSLVEEFMLLANMAVAKKIENAFPEKAILRRHPGPKVKVIKEVEDTCRKIGFPLDGTHSSGVLSSSLNKYRGNDALMRSVNQVLSMLLMKPMQLAQYFCVGARQGNDYSHYALACPYYTHFTSPIRRYPDVLVHRFLAASLGYTTAPTAEVHALQVCAEYCNDKKAAAKTVSEGSDKLFFGLFVKQCGPIEERGVVVNVLDLAFDVLIFKYGVIERVYVNKLDMAREPHFSDDNPARLTLHWNSDDNGPAVTQLIQMCTVVDVVISSLSDPTKYQTKIKKRSSAETNTLHQMYDSGKPLE